MFFLKTVESGEPFHFKSKEFIKWISISIHREEYHHQIGYLPKNAKIGLEI